MNEAQREYKKELGRVLRMKVSMSVKMELLLGLQ